MRKFVISCFLLVASFIAIGQPQRMVLLPKSFSDVSERWLCIDYFNSGPTGHSYNRLLWGNGSDAELIKTQGVMGGTLEKDGNFSKI